MDSSTFGLKLLLVLVIMVAGISEVNCTSKSSNLLERLLKNYGPPSVRPVKEESTKTEVIFRILVTQIVDLEEQDQVLTLSGWLKWIWFDDNLKWNTRKNPGVTKLAVPIDKIWMPDISLHTNVDLGFERLKSTHALVYPNGEVFYSTPAIFMFTCKINARIFPFDWQVCNMTFSSWNYHSEEMDILPINGSDSFQNQFAQNGIWQLRKVKIRHNENYYYTGPKLKPFPELVYSLYLKRRPVFHVLNLLVPCLLLSFLNLTVYMLPPEAGEKIGLGMTNLLALVLFQTLVNQALPPSSDSSPIISYYFTPMIGLSCISIINAVLVLKLFYYGRQNRPIPKWMRTILVQCLAPMVFYEMIAYEDDLRKTTSAEPEVEDEDDGEENGINVKDRTGNNRVVSKLPRYGTWATEQDEVDPAIVRSHRATDWQNVALIWDKFMMIVMTLLTGVALCCVFFLYVAEVTQNDVDFDDEAGMEVAME